VNPDAVAADQLLFTVADVARLTRIGRTTLYQEMQAGRLKVVRIGRAVRITRAELDRWIRDLEAMNDGVV